ncbi:PIN domain-containing protein [Ornithinimicrobium cryptoxanthini]|uniref:PIN domain-containing protein n=1 Tax=Ornithinimicrobium cryptoxanthini TaxID=2934161 RepID=UPI0021184A7D|nr:PIN domain-containing protein [Ornithinimicrobium cryptoxanthini]
MTGPVVLLDACVLVPYPLVSALLTVGEHELFEPRWSEQILDELERTLTAKLGVDQERAKHRLTQMRAGFPEASVHGFEDLIEEMTCDTKDRHVLAAAVAAGADLLVTVNLKDFPEASYQPYGLEVIDPETLLSRLFIHDEEDCIEVLQSDAGRRRNPPMTIEQLLAQLASYAPTFANNVHQRILGGVGPVSDVPALVAAELEWSPMHQALTDPDPQDPLSVAANWWKALLDRDHLLDILDLLTFHPPAWHGYQWAADLLDDKSIATKVYYAVDAPDDLAFVRFVPEVAQSSRVFADYTVADGAYLTMVRLPDNSWRVWGLGPRMTSAKAVGVPPAFPRTVGTDAPA